MCSTQLHGIQGKRMSSLCCPRERSFRTLIQKEPDYGLSIATAACSPETLVLSQTTDTQFVQNTSSQAIRVRIPPDCMAIQVGECTQVWTPGHSSRECCIFTASCCFGTASLQRPLRSSLPENLWRLPTVYEVVVQSMRMAARQPVEISPGSLT